MLRINSATKNLLVLGFEESKNIKQILHFVQNDNLVNSFSFYVGERKIMNYSVVNILFFILVCAADVFIEPRLIQGK
jgi:hypothetical protein